VGDLEVLVLDCIMYWLEIFANTRHGRIMTATNASYGLIF
jgi:hypothetical protein